MKHNWTKVPKQPSLKEIQQEIIRHSIAIGAIKIQPEEPFPWACGYKMPIYVDHRELLRYPLIRASVVEGLQMLIKDHNMEFDTIAGIAKGGIPWAMALSLGYNVPMAYVMKEPKSHGLKNLIEGLNAEKNFDEDEKILIIDDLLSTGEDPLKAISSVRAAHGRVSHFVSIFDYEFEETKKLFKRLKPRCTVTSLISWPIFMEVVEKEKLLPPQQITILKEWIRDPFAWGENHGFAN